MTCTFWTHGPRGHLKRNRRQNSVQTGETVQTYFSYASSSSTQKQWRSARLLTFCFSMAKYSRSEGGREMGGGVKGPFTSRAPKTLLLPLLIKNGLQCFLKNTHAQLPSFYSPLMNSMHFDDTSSAVMLPTAENMLCRETHESVLLHGVSLILC